MWVQSVGSVSKSAHHNVCTLPRYTSYIGSAGLSGYEKVDPFDMVASIR